MANDRMWLECLYCGEGYLLAKVTLKVACYGNEPGFLDFVEKHLTYCHPGGLTGDVHCWQGNPGLRLVTESERPKEEAAP